MALVTCHTCLGVKGRGRESRRVGPAPGPSPTGVEPLRHMEAALEGETQYVCAIRRLMALGFVDLESFFH